MLYIRLGDGGRLHGIVTFATEEAIDELMAQRPHVIDGQEVSIHRSVPILSSMNKDFGIQNVIIAAENHEALAQPDISRYLSKYGTIAEILLINKDDNVWNVCFDE